MTQGFWKDKIYNYHGLSGHDSKEGNKKEKTEFRDLIQQGLFCNLQIMQAAFHELH